VSRTRILEAAFACAARYGLAKTTMEDVGREAGLSRATVYRYFPKGKDELMAEVVAWQVAAFFDELTRAVAGRTDIADVLVETLVFARAAVEGHAVLQKILETEPDRLLPMLTVEGNRLLAVVKQFLALAMQRGDPLPPGVDGDAAADYLARMLLSHIGAQGGWDLNDRDQVRKLVESEFLPGLR
jgi:AcrR family transcriptional regulator